MLNDVSYAVKQLGLSPITSEVFQALLRAGEGTVEGISAALREPTQDVEAGLTELQRLGLASRSALSEDLYVVVAPDDSLRLMLEASRGRLQRLEAAVPVLTAAFSDAHRARATDATADNTGNRVLTDPASIASWFARLHQRAHARLLVFDRPPYVSSPQEDLEGVSITRGVRLRGLYTSASFDRPGALEEIRRLAARGEESRVVGDLPVKMAIADSSTALVSLSLEEDSPTALLTHSPALIDLLVWVFEAYWETGVRVEAGALPLNETAAAPQGTGQRGAIEPAPIDAQQRLLLSLIGAGLTDEAIAESLSMSVRSVRRRTQTLLTRANVSTRFQLGVVAARRGWV